MLKRSMQAVLVFVCVLPVGACAVATDETGGSFSEDLGDESSSPEPEIGRIEQELTGVVNTNGCTSGEQQSAQLAVEAARFIAVSTGYAECLAVAMQVPLSLVHMGAPMSVGPYVAQSGDPFGGSDLITKFTNALYAAQSTNNVSITCGGSGYTDAVGASAFIGSWNADRDSPEVLNARPGWGGFAAMDDLQTTTTAQFYQFARQAIANLIWHEGMHQWGYRHAGGSVIQPSFLQTIPYIVGACMEAVMLRSSQCTLDCNTAGTGRRPVMRSSSATCECVEDPQFDVGVMPDPGEICPWTAGRFLPSQTELYLDNEDTNNNNSRSGWIGQNVSDYNTRLKFCTVPGRKFKQLLVSSTDSTAPRNYAVARMGANCPPGAVAMSRYFDDEDTNNNNSSVGHVAPHQTGANTRLQLCMFRETTSATNSWPAPFPDLGIRYGVFAPTNMPFLVATGFIRTDDEDNNNKNNLGGSFSGSNVFLNPAGANTRLSLARVR